MTNVEKSEWLANYVFDNRNHFDDVEKAAAKQILLWIENANGYEALDLALERFITNFKPKVEASLKKKKE